MRAMSAILLTVFAGPALAETWDNRSVFLESADGQRIEVAYLNGAPSDYTMTLNDAVFGNHFLSMRPIKCIEGPDKTWCHVPYPYEIARDVSSDPTDLEYDFLFVWKDRGDYGIDFWNGVYYVLYAQGDGYLGQMHEMNMDILAVPPEAGVMRPIREVDLEEADPDSHWLPRLVIE